MLDTKIDSLVEKEFLNQLTFTADEESNTVFVSDIPFKPEEILKSNNEAYENAFWKWKYEEWLPLKKQKAEEILNIAANQGRFRDLVDAVRRENVLPFIVSG